MAYDEQKQKEEIREVFDKLFNQLNYIGSESEIQEILEEKLNNLHRTLRQSFFRGVIIPSIKLFAKHYEESNYDARNEDSCKLASELAKQLDSVYLPFI